jgi:LmbE family N-acetylglucosaminyl deacetylase
LNGRIFEKIIVLSPHTDDGELGAGGTISRFIEEGSVVDYIAFSAPTKKLKQECIEATKKLGIDNTRIFNFERRCFPSQRQEILQVLYDLNIEKQPDLILTPCTADHHQDHETVTNEAIRIFKKSTILGYILPWNTLDSFENCIIELKEKHLEKKLYVLSFYESQKEHSYFKKSYTESNIIAHGVKINSKYAEVFEVIRLVL